MVHVTGMSQRELFGRDPHERAFDVVPAVPAGFQLGAPDPQERMTRVPIQRVPEDPVGEISLSQVQQRAREPGESSRISAAFLAADLDASRERALLASPPPLVPDGDVSRLRAAGPAGEEGNCRRAQVDEGRRGRLDPRGQLSQDLRVQPSGREREGDHVPTLVVTDEGRTTRDLDGPGLLEPTRFAPPEGDETPLVLDVRQQPGSPLLERDRERGLLLVIGRLDHQRLRGQLSGAQLHHRERTALVFLALLQSDERDQAFPVGMRHHHLGGDIGRQLPVDLGAALVTEPVLLSLASGDENERRLRAGDWIETERSVHAPAHSPFFEVDDRDGVLPVGLLELRPEIAARRDDERVVDSAVREHEGADGEPSDHAERAARELKNLAVPAHDVDGAAVYLDRRLCEWARRAQPAEAAQSPALDIHLTHEDPTPEHRHEHQGRRPLRPLHEQRPGER